MASRSSKKKKKNNLKALITFYRGLEFCDVINAYARVRVRSQTALIRRYTLDGIGQYRRTDKGFYVFHNIQDIRFAFEYVRRSASIKKEKSNYKQTKRVAEYIHNYSNGRLSFAKAVKDVQFSGHADFAGLPGQTIRAFPLRLSVAVSLLSDRFPG